MTPEKENNNTKSNQVEPPFSKPRVNTVVPHHKPLAESPWG